MKMVTKFCRVCGRSHRAKPGQPHSKTCSCGGKLVSDPVASARARQELAKQQRKAIQDEIAEIDREINELQEAIHTDEGATSSQ